MRLKIIVVACLVLCSLGLSAQTNTLSSHDRISNDSAYFEEGLDSLEKFIATNISMDSLKKYDRAVRTIVTLKIDSNGMVSKVTNVDSCCWFFNFNTEIKEALDSSTGWTTRKYQRRLAFTKVHLKIQYNTRDDKINCSYEEMTFARYSEGNEGMNKIMRTTINYPMEAEDEEIQGTVKIQMKINPDGTVSDIKALTKLGYGLEEESLRVVKSLKNWEPGKIGYIPISVYMIIPVMFTLEEEY